jgi:hypothetical protein
VELGRGRRGDLLRGGQGIRGDKMAEEESEVAEGHRRLSPVESGQEHVGFPDQEESAPRADQGIYFAQSGLSSKTRRFYQGMMDWQEIL